MIKIVIGGFEYTSYSDFIVEESLDFSFRIELSLVNTLESPLLDSFLHKPVVICYYPEDGELDQYSWIGPLEAKAYYGYVHHEQKKYDMHGLLFAIHLEIYHPIQLLQTSSKFRIFHEKKLTEIFDAIFTPYKEIFDKYKINGWPYSDDLKEITLDYCTQYEETDLHFFLRLCETYGVRMILHGQSIRLQGVKCKPLLPGLMVNFIPFEARVEMTEHSSSLARTFHHRNVLETIETDALATKKIEAKGPENSIPPQPYWVDLFEHDTKTAEEKLTIQKQALEHQQFYVEINNSKEAGSSIERNNNPMIGVRCGEIYSTIGLVPKVYYIHKLVCHCGGPVAPGFGGSVAKDPTYRIKIHAREQQIPYVMPMRHHKPKVESFLRAKVIEPKSPPQGDGVKLGRVKVQFLWQEEEAPVCWVRLMMPYAGKTHGFYVMPEIGDEVLIGFEGGDIDRPLCFGSAYNKDAKELPTLGEAQQMETLWMRTPQNIFLKYHEVPGGAQTSTTGIRDKVVTTAYHSKGAAHLIIHCQGKQQSKITMDNDGKIVIESDNSIEVRSKEISVDASEKLSLKGGQIEINSPGEIVVKGQVIRLN